MVDGTKCTQETVMLIGECIQLDWQVLLAYSEWVLYGYKTPYIESQSSSCGKNVS
jgi:hypothetical protein